MASNIPVLEDDGLLIPEVGLWGEQKYRLVHNYASMFATSMKGKWQCRVYIDLFAGAGFARIEKTSRIVAASPLIALNIRDRFDVYVFCEADETKHNALRARISRLYSNIDARLIEGDANQKVAEILQNIHQNRAGFKVLSFCFADSYSLSNLAFETIRRLASRSMDFLVLVPSGMDANRNVSYYLDTMNTTVDRFLGDFQWRDDWKKVEQKGKSFGHYISDRFDKQMKALGYHYSGIQETVQIRSTEKNLPLYHLAFFSRHKLGEKFWKEAKKYSKGQLELFS